VEVILYDWDHGKLLGDLSHSAAAAAAAAIATIAAHF